MTELKTAKCPACGAAINVPENQDKCYCSFCGSQIIVKEAISQGINIKSLFEIVKAAQEAGNHQEAIRICKDILLNDPQNSDAWGIMGLSEYKMNVTLGIGRAFNWFLFQRDFNKGQSKSLAATNYMMMVRLLPELYQTWIQSQKSKKQ